MLKAALLAIVLLACTAVGRSLLGANALRAGVNASRMDAVDKFHLGVADQFHAKFLGEVVPC